MAKAPEEKEPSGEAIAVVPSDLDEKTHAEMLMIYNECANSVRFAKSQQWTTTGGALAIFMALGILGEPRVNVLLLNIDLDRRFQAKR